MISSTQHHHVIAHQLIKGQLDFRAIAQRVRLRASYDGQLVGDALGSDLLDDADYGIAHDDNHEQHVLVRASEQHDESQDGIHQVEQRADVIMHDLPDRPRLHARIDIDFACGDTHLHFFGC